MCHHDHDKAIVLLLACCPPFPAFTTGTCPEGCSQWSERPPPLSLTVSHRFCMGAAFLIPTPSWRRCRLPSYPCYAIPMALRCRRAIKTAPWCYCGVWANSWCHHGRRTSSLSCLGCCASFPYQWYQCHWDEVDTIKPRLPSWHVNVKQPPA